jgi:hypothetical protein
MALSELVSREERRAAREEPLVKPMSGAWTASVRPPAFWT